MRAGRACSFDKLRTGSASLLCNCDLRSKASSGMDLLRRVRLILVPCLGIGLFAYTYGLLLQSIGL